MSQEHISEKELQVVVLGFHDSGKTSIINTLCSETGPDNEKVTVSCVRKEVDVCGRKLILIDTPGWWRTYPLSDTANIIKHKLVLSMSMCPPGPHAFLLVVDTDVPFTTKNKRSIEEHVGLFGEKVWEHIIVVFTRGEYLSGNSIDKHIENEGDALKWLIEKCGNRYLMFLINDAEGCNANQLLNQIDNIIAFNGNKNFEIDEKTLRDVERRRITQRERAKLRQQKVMEQRAVLHKHGFKNSLQEIRILLLGWLFSGKTSAKMTILYPGKHIDPRDTRVKRSRTCKSKRHSRDVAERQVSVMDTPGWWKYFPAKYTPEWVKSELQEGLDFQGPHAILLAVPADTTFNEEQREVTEDNMKMFGDQVWRHTIVLFTCGDRLGNISIEEHIESEGEPLQWLIEKCGNRYHVMTWNDEEDKVIELLEKVEHMMTCNSILWPESKAQNPVDEDITRNQMDVPSEMIHFLDQEWKRLDKELEKKLVDIEFKGSMDTPLAEWHEDQQSHAGQTENMREILEREWGRRELGVTQRLKCLFSAEKQSGSEVDVHDRSRSYRKVIQWRNFKNQTSGFGSDSPPDTDEVDH